MSNGARFLSAAFTAVLFTAGSLAAQTSPQPPKPGAEHQALESFVGTTKCEFTDSTGKSTATQTCEMTAGGFFLHCRYKSERGREVIAIMGYLAGEKAYTMYRYWDNGWSDFSRGWIHEKTWTWVFEDEWASQKLRRRQATLTELSPGSFTIKWERSVEGEPWRVTQEGKCTKTK